MILTTEKINKLKKITVSMDKSLSNVNFNLTTTLKIP